MRQESPYRQMELGDAPRGAAQLSPELVREQMEQARKQAEFYEAQHAQYEAQRRALDDANERKTMFNDGLNDIGTRLHNAVKRLEKELESMDREQREVTQVTECLKRHLQILSALQPHTWNPAEYQQRIDEAIPKLERAENDFNEAYADGNNYRHTDVFLHKPGEEEVPRYSWANLRRKMAEGLAFHLPLYLLLLLTGAVYYLILQF